MHAVDPECATVAQASVTVFQQFNTVPMALRLHFRLVYPEHSGSG